MNEKETHKLIGKLSGAVVFLSVLVIALIITILVLFAFTKPKVKTVEEPDVAICGNHLLHSNSGTPAYYIGEGIFKRECASCHFPDKDMTGPALKGARERGEEYAYKDWIYDFIQKEDSLVRIRDPYTLGVREKWNYTVRWTHQFELTRTEIDDLMNYIY